MLSSGTEGQLLRLRKTLDGRTRTIML